VFVYQQAANVKNMTAHRLNQIQSINLSNTHIKYASISTDKQNTPFQTNNS